MRDEDSSLLARAWLARAPVAVLAYDGEGRVRWVNPALEVLFGLSAEQLVGKPREALPSPARDVLFGGDGIQAYTTPAATHWLRCTTTREIGPEALVVRSFEDASREAALAAENRDLRAQVEALRLTDDLTGLPNRRALRQQLELHVSRSRRYGNPLSLIYVRLEVAGAAQAPDSALVATARHLRDRLRWVDQIARWGQEEFLVVLPETAHEEASRVTTNLLGSPEGPTLPEHLGDPTITLHHGMATWARGDDVRALVQRAHDAVDGGARLAHG